MAIRMMVLHKPIRDKGLHLVTRVRVYRKGENALYSLICRYGFTLKGEIDGNKPVTRDEAKKIVVAGGVERTER